MAWDTGIAYIAEICRELQIWSSVRDRLSSLFMVASGTVTTVVRLLECQNRSWGSGKQSSKEIRSVMPARLLR